MNKELEFLEEKYGHNSWNNYPPSKQEVAQWLKEWAEKQFAISGVVKSLPTKSELVYEAEEYVSKNKDKSPFDVGVDAYIKGFSKSINISYDALQD